MASFYKNINSGRDEDSDSDSEQLTGKKIKEEIMEVVDRILFESGKHHNQSTSTGSSNAVGSQTDVVVVTKLI